MFTAHVDIAVTIKIQFIAQLLLGQKAAGDVLLSCTIARNKSFAETLCAGRTCEWGC